MYFTLQDNAFLEDSQFLNIILVSWKTITSEGLLMISLVILGSRVISATEIGKNK